MRPLLVGQAPGPNTDPAEPLSGRCGARLADLCGLTLAEFMGRFERANVLGRFPGKSGKGDDFPIDETRVPALILSRDFAGRRVVLLGANVARAFAVDPAWSNFGWRFKPWGSLGLAYCPHPSGVNRWWNDPANVRGARRFWRRLALETALDL